MKDDRIDAGAIRLYNRLCRDMNVYAIHALRMPQSIADVIVSRTAKTTRVIVIVRGGGVFGDTQPGKTFHDESLAVANAIDKARASLIVGKGTQSKVRPGMFTSEEADQLHTLFAACNSLRIRGGANWINVLSEYPTISVNRVL